MNPVKCAIFNETLAKELGKNDSNSDLKFYHRLHNERTVTFLYPTDYPEKITSLLQILHLSDYVLLYVDRIDSSLGELILAIDALGKERGFLTIDDGIDEELLRRIIKGTSVENFEKIEKSEILEKISTAASRENAGSAIADLDEMFTVRGLGTVALGFVTQGIVKKFQTLKSFPNAVDVLVKSIQKQDKDYKEADCGDRVGLALKGIEPENFSRGMILTNDPEFSSATEIKVEFTKNNFCKRELTEKLQLHLQCRMQIAGCVIKSLNPFVLETGKPIAMRKNEPITLIDINAKPRIVGKGRII